MRDFTQNEIPGLNEGGREANFRSTLESRLSQRAKSTVHVYGARCRPTSIKYKFDVWPLKEPNKLDSQVEDRSASAWRCLQLKILAKQKLS